MDSCYHSTYKGQLRAHHNHGVCTPIEGTPQLRQYIALYVHARWRDFHLDLFACLRRHFQTINLTTLSEERKFFFLLSSIRVIRLPNSSTIDQLSTMNPRSILRHLECTTIDYLPSTMPNIDSTIKPRRTHPIAS